MTEEVNNVTLGYSATELSEIVDRELKSPESITKSELSYLSSHKPLWRTELVRMKKRTEFQLTSSRARQFTLYKEKLNSRLTEFEYVDKLQAERVWRCNAIRFIQQLESRIAQVKIIEDD